MGKDTRIDRIVSQFTRSEWFATWQAENTESGAYSADPDRRDRFARCYDAAEYGADGSTHREQIDDMRNAFGEWLRMRHRGKLTEFYWRVQDAGAAYFDRLETWHERNGSIDHEIG